MNESTKQPLQGNPIDKWSLSTDIYEEPNPPASITVDFWYGGYHYRGVANLIGEDHEAEQTNPETS